MKYVPCAPYADCRRLSRLEIAHSGGRGLYLRGPEELFEVRALSLGGGCRAKVNLHIKSSGVTSLSRV
jgi:hypothetical protein